MVFLLLLLVPITVTILSFVFLKTVTLKEFFLQFGVAILIAGACAGAMSCESTHDTETLSGVVTGKEQDRVSCSHSYDCRCRTKRRCSGTGKNRSCYNDRVCDTCYRHNHDYNWNVETTIGGFTISRLDSQGVDMPPRWASVNQNDPVATTHGYDNYVKAAPDSLFRHTGLVEKYQGQLPDYPNDVYDYYKMNRTVAVGLTLPDINEWNHSLMLLNGELGAKKQVNIIVVVAKNKPQDWFYALEQHWIGGKKNDAILVINIDSQDKITWAQVMGWTTDKVLEVKLRDDVLSKPFNRDAVVKSLHDNVNKYYKRKPMKDFEYLKSSITPSTTAWTISLILTVLVSFGLAFMCHRHDVFGEE